MGRTYQLIKNGKFTEEKEFDVNVSGYVYLGIIMHSLGLPTSEGMGSHTAPHEITGQTAEAIRNALKSDLNKGRVASAISMIEGRESYSTGTIEEDTDWVMEFLEMSNNPEGFASDYCDQYHHEHE